MHPLIDARELADRVGEVRPVDVRWSLAEPGHGREAFIAGHIPGAVFADLDKDLSGPPGLDGRHPLPPVADFAAALGRLGIDPGDEVVAYDDSGGSVAARLWWMLRSIGHARVRVLDGGIQAWLDGGHPVEGGEVAPPHTRYPEPGEFTGVVDRHGLTGRALIDVRAPERYRGEFEPVDPKAGHIPGAVNMPLARNLAPDGRFLPLDQLAQLYADIDARPVVSCGSGVNACHTALAMVLAGQEMPDVYVGSFSEWSGLGLPVETGP